MTSLFVLLVLFQVKHMLCDFPFQTPYMLQTGKATGWALPLLAHVSVHAAFTLLIGLGFAAATGFVVLSCGKGVLLALADGAGHFIIDRLKAHPKLGGRWAPTHPLFWSALGLDQMAHHLCHFAIIGKMLNLW